MELNATVRVRPQESKRHRIYIFDANSAPKEVDLISLIKTEVTFGRDASNDIVLTSHLVSRNHGKISHSNEDWHITDLGSTNGIIYHSHTTTEINVRNDDFIRIDDGVETIPDGVLIIFATDDYSDIWESVSSAKWESTYDLDLIYPDIHATIERFGNSIYLNIHNPDFYVNQEKSFGRIILHEKDVIACKGIRLVYTSKSIYVNRLKPSQTDSTVTQYISQRSSTVINRNISSYSSVTNPPIFPESHQKNHPIYSEIVSGNSDFTENPMDNQSVHQEATDDKHDQNNTHSPTSNYDELRRFLASDLGYYVLSFAIAIIIWGIAVALWTSQGDLALIVVFACAIFGWQALNHIQPSMFIWMSWTGWIVYFFVKFILSAIVGLFVAPFKIGKWIAGTLSKSIM